MVSPPVNSECGDPPIVSYEADGIATFCESQEVVFINTTFEPLGFYDFFVINWGDASPLDTIYNYENVSHKFDFSNLDRCEEGPKIIGEYCYVGIKNCGDGITSHGQSGFFQVKLRPVADFSFEQIVCIDQEVSFKEESCNGDTYAWDFNGDGITDSNEPDPVFTFSTSGPQQISLEVTNDCGSDKVTYTIEVVEKPEAVIDLGFTGGEICGPDFQTITLNANEWVTGPSSFFRWKLTPSYSGSNGAWCFVDPANTNSGLICLQDSELTDDIVDSLLQLQELSLYFNQPGEYQVTLEYGNACESKTISEMISVYAPPLISNIPDQSGCDDVTVRFSDLNMSVSGDYTALEWVFENGSSSGSTNLDFGSVSFSSNGTLSLSVSAIAPCLDVLEMADVNVIATQTVSIPDPVPNVICQNAGLIPLSPSAPGGEYLHDGSTADFITNDLLDPSQLDPGVYTVAYVLSDNPDCPSEDDFSFTIQEGPSVTLGENETVCERISGFNPAISSFGGDIDAWNWTIFTSAGGVVGTSAAPNPAFTIDVADTYTIILELRSDECGIVMDTSTLVIQPNVEAVINPFNNPYCQGSDPVTLTASPPGGRWSGSGIVDQAEGVFDPSQLAPGTYQIVYSIANGACNAMVTRPIEVVASESVVVEDTFFCLTDAPSRLTASPAGGEFSGEGIIDASGLFDPAQADLGGNSIVYTFVDGNNCAVTGSFTVEVDAVPTLALNDTIFVCIGDEDVAVSDLLAINTEGVDGTLSFSGEGIINSQSGLFNGSGLDAGLYTIELDFVTRSCAVRDSFVIKLAEKPSLTLSEDETVCVSDGSYVLTANILGGIWSSPNCVIDPLTGEIDLASIGEADCVFRYELNAGTSCAQSEVVNVTILDLANNLQIPAPASICYTMGHYTIPNFAPADGIWTGQGIIDPANGVIEVSGLTPGDIYVYTYCIESDEIDCAACQTFELTIESLPVADFSLLGSPCQNQSFSVENTSTNAESFSWNFGSGQVNGFEPSHTYTSFGEQTITLIAATDFGCTDTSSQRIKVTAPPTLDLAVFTQEGCAPLSIAYTNNSRGEDVSQYWVIDGVDTLFGAQPDILLDHVTTDSLITLELVVFNDCETLRQTAEVLVHPYPTVDFGINDDEGCSPDTVFFSNATLGEPETFLWNFGLPNASDTAFNPPPQIYYSPDDSVSTYTISLFASNACGEDRLEKEIQVYPNNVEAFFELDTLSGCPPLTVMIQNYATRGATVTYDFGDGGTANTPDFTFNHTYTEPGKYVITQYASLCGTDWISSDTITVFPLANLDFVAPAFACVGDSVHFLNRSTGGVVSRWLFGDGSTSDDLNSSHMYTAPGTYEVSLIMNSIFNDCPDTLIKSIFIPELPRAAFAPTPQDVCPGEEISFENQSIGALNYAWDFGNGNGSEEENPTHVYHKSGAYEVGLRVFDEYGCSEDTSLINLLVHSVPISSFALSSDEICQYHDTLTVTNISIGFVNSIWNLNGELYTDQQNNIQLSSEEWGDQALTLIVGNAFGCRDTSQAAFEVLPTPIAQASFGESTGCQELTLDFIDRSVNANLIRWNFDGNNASTDSISTYTFLEAGDYSVQLIASNTNNCPSDTAFIPVEVFPRAIADFAFGPFDSCGIPLDVQLINTSEISSDFFWNMGNGTSSTLSDPSAVFNAPGTYEIALISSNVFNCPDTIKKSITAYTAPRAGFTVPATEVCEGDTITVLNTSTGSNAFYWYLNGEIFVDFPLLITERGDYNLTLIASYAEVCFDTIPLGTDIFVYDSPRADFTAIIDENSNIIGDVRYVNSSADAESFLWEFGDGNTSEQENPTHEYDRDGPVTVTLSAYNTNGGQFTCVDRTLQLIDFERINTFFVPNALSPDQNYGNNEVGVFKPKGIGIEAYELNIYSPWGDKVATLNQVFEGQPTDSWDGTFNGEPVPQGAYLWTASIKYLNGHTDFKKGNVTVIR